MKVSVIIATHNPHAERMQRTLGGLSAQTLAIGDWETLLVDNASMPAIASPPPNVGPPNLRIVREPQLGLTSARRRGFREARGEICVFADDDNVLAPDYLEQVVRLFATHSRVGALGGKSVAEFESTPPDWAVEFFPLLALRDPGDEARFARSVRAAGAPRNDFPFDVAPIGAGMAVRREAVQAWVDESAGSGLPDRRGADLTSGGDNDLVFSILQHGWEVAYFPELSLAHLIPAARLAPEYLGRLNRGIQNSWMQVLTKHDANPWPPIRPWSVTLRQLKAWFAYRAWSSPAARIRWQGACGHFEGRRASPGAS
ncbi:MAG: glycosyltransferase [Opitutaceae bacterium]|nr:glycosyltransferase [Opitutaceae bacterium]